MNRPAFDRPVFDRVAVVVPAHDEQDLLPFCLAALALNISAEIIVVADACADGTAVVAAAAGAEVVLTDARNVGHARAAGMAHALRNGPGGLWLATTDADSRVPPHWIAWHLGHARTGADLLCGTVEVDDWSLWPPGVPDRYSLSYDRTGGHVHGANLGVSARAYLAAGGFPATAHDEDQGLVARVRATGGRVVGDTGCPVVTSARPHGRAPIGFAGHLRDLAAQGRIAST